MDTNELRRLAAEVDEEHRAAMRDLPDRLAAEVTDADPATKASRRALLRRLGLAGAALGTTAVSLPAMAGLAAAQESTTTTATGSTAATTTTTLPPKKPTTEDIAIFSFAQSLELAASAAYDAVAATGKLSGDVLRVAVTFGSHHLQHAQAFAGLAGKAATGMANQSVLAKFTPLIQAAADQNALLAIAFQLENVAASTYTQALGTLVGTDGAAAVASIQPIESRHALVIGQALQLPADQYLIPFQTTADAVSPADYPIISR